MSLWCEEHNHTKRNCPWCEIEEYTKTLKNIEDIINSERPAHWKVFKIKEMLEE